jgi:Resolvase, N terminal domain
MATNQDRTFHGSRYCEKQHSQGYQPCSPPTGNQRKELQVGEYCAAKIVRTGTARLFPSVHGQSVGTLDNWKELARVLDRLRPGDTLVVWRLDRLGRSLRHLGETVTALADHKIGFRSLTGHPTPKQLSFTVGQSRGGVNRDGTNRTVDTASYYDQSCSLWVTSSCGEPTK